MDDASPRWHVDAHGCASWLRRLVKLVDFPQKTSYLPSVLFAWLRWRRSRLSSWCNFITQLAMNQMFPRRRIDVGTKSISFVLISKPSHSFVFSSPVILFVQLLTLIKKWCGLKTRMDVVALHFYLLRILDLTEVKRCKVWPSLDRTQQTIIIGRGQTVHTLKPFR